MKVIYKDKIYIKMENKNSLISKLTLLLSKLPNIGPRQARRLSYFLSRYDPKILDEIAKLF
jgi:recombinational DNA repair protein RecR